MPAKLLFFKFSMMWESSVEFAESVEILLLAFNAFYLRDKAPARNHFVDFLGTDSLLFLLLHYAKAKFWSGILLALCFVINNGELCFQNQSGSRHVYCNLQLR